MCLSISETKSDGVTGSRSDDGVGVATSSRNDDKSRSEVTERRDEEVRMNRVTNSRST